MTPLTPSIPETLALDEGTYLKGIPTGDDTKFLANSNFSRLTKVVTDPRELQPGRKRTGYNAADLEAEAELHELVQRALTGAKRSNVPKYAEYIYDVLFNGRPGVLPPMHLWTPQTLSIATQGCDQYALVPDGERLLAIDGETQLTADFHLHEGLTAEEKQVHRQYPLQQVIHHGVSVTVAQQMFHDLNVLAVRPNTSLGLAMDSIDPLMGVVRRIEELVPFIKGRVERQARQLKKTSSKVITVQSERQMILNVWKGISGVQYGAKPAPTEGVDLDDVRDAAVIWLNAYFDAFGNAVVDREDSLAGSPPILAAVGAVGHAVYLADPSTREAVAAGLIEQLRPVRWEKGPHWVGIAGAMKARGFSVNSTKEASYAVYNVLLDESNVGYRQIRSAAPAPVQAGLEV